MAYKVIIPAAGQGKRMGAGKNKLLIEVNDIPVIIQTLLVFEKDEQCEEIILPLHPEDTENITSLIEQYQLKKVISYVAGGKERQHSVYNGLKAINDKDGIVLVHDAARPFIDRKLIHKLVEVTETAGAAVIAVPVKDTIKKVSNKEVVETVERSSLWAIQTPQAFRISLLLEAHKHAEETKYVGTDDASLIELINKPVKIVEGNYDNIKLTTPEDLYFAEAIMKKRQMI